MARKSRNNVTKAAAGEKAWMAGLYIRLSKEDGNDESLSVANQRELLQQHIERLRREDGDDYTIHDIYIDDGQSGTDYDRPGFRHLLADIEAGKVNLVLVKDLSRPFRNYADQGYFLEEFFPRHDVRFVSLGLPPLDSYRNPDMMNNIAVPIQGVINDNHCRETSMKVRQVFDMKRRKGQFIGAFAPYGYLKVPNDKGRFIVDEEAAQVVKDIFIWYLGGMSKNGIVHKLNDLGVPCPSLYKRNKGMRYQNPCAAKQTPLWSIRTVANILRDQDYVGDMVQGRYRVKSYKIHTQVATPKEEWFIVEGTHEPVIDRETFEKALALQKRDTRTAPNSGQLYLFCGLLRCADCGRGLSRHTAKAGQTRYYCSTYKNRSKAACTKHAIRHDRLEEAVRLAIRQQIFIGVAAEELIAAVDAAPAQRGQAIQLDMQIKDRETELQKITRYIQFLYEDWKEGNITHEDYQNMREEYGRQTQRLNDTLKNLAKEKSDKEKKAGTDDPLFHCLKQHGSIDALTRELLTELVERIEVHEGGDIVIRFRFADEYRRAALRGDI